MPLQREMDELWSLEAARLEASRWERPWKKLSLKRADAAPRGEVWSLRWAHPSPRLFPLWPEHMDIKEEALETAC